VHFEPVLFAFCARSSTETMSKKPLIAQRWLMIAFATLGSALMYILRYNISVAIVAMVQPKNMHHLEQQRKLEMALHLIPSNSTLTHFSRSARSLPGNASTNLLDSSPTLNSSSDSIHMQPIPYIGYDWDDNVQGIVLSSYFYG
jgi:hypothetical protein